MKKKNPYLMEKLSDFHWLKIKQFFLYTLCIEEHKKDSKYHGSILCKTQH